MSMTALTSMQWIALIALGVMVIAGIAMLLFFRKRQTGKLRDRFGGAEYDRAVQAGGSRRHGEAGLAGRTQRVESFHLRPLAAADRARFEDSWRTIQARFVDGPAGAVADADRLLGDVMSTRGYPVSDFEQRAADISVDHPLVLKNYRTAHDTALRQARGEASTEDLRQAIMTADSMADHRPARTDGSGGNAWFATTHWSVVLAAASALGFLGATLFLLHKPWPLENLLRRLVGGVRGKGKGGRNQEFALAAALDIAGLRDVVVLSAGTDGRDGPTDAAGALADGETVARAVGLGLKPRAALDGNDAYPFFERLGDLVMTGPTRTNVMDVRLVLVG